MTRLFHKGRYANVTATLALIVALGGTSYAATTLKKNSVSSKQIKNSSITSSDVKNNTLTGSDIKESKLGTVPSATSATAAATAAHAISADNATHATTADKASTLPALSYHPLTLINDWFNYNDPDRIPSYAVDAQGIVHFRGAICCGSSTNAFTLPPAISPDVGIWLTADENGSATGRIFIGTDGNVYVDDDPDDAGSAADFTSLDGITYIP
jgi:hypothetical protein